MRIHSILFLLCALLVVSAPSATAQPLASGAPLIKLEALRSHPHNPEHFTQGLFFYGDDLYESFGGYGESGLARKDPQTGRTLRQLEFSARYFAEGATMAGGSIYVLTWQEGVAFFLNPDSLEMEGWFNYPGEGWGLTYDGRRLIRSDGSNTLYFYNAGQLQGTLDVYDGDQPVTHLNELEWLPEQKLILANVWRTERIAAIDPESGRVAFWLDMAALVPENLRGDIDYVPNGIAIAPDGKTLWLTGKCWPVIHEVAWPPAALRQ